MVLGCKEGKTFIKMKKLSKNKSLASSWEGPFIFVRYLDGHGFLQHDERGRIYVVKREDEKLWERPWRDLQLFHATNYRVKIMGFKLGRHYICDEKSRDVNLGGWNITSTLKVKWQTFDDWWWWEVMCGMCGFYFCVCLFFCRLWTCYYLWSMTLELFLVLTMSVLCVEQSGYEDFLFGCQWKCNDSRV